MWVRFVTLGCCLVLMSLAAGCKREPLAGIDAPERLTLYSLHPQELDPEEVAKAGETFHGWRVLGKVEIKEPEKRKELVDALKDAIARPPEFGAKCFIPRHGLQIVEQGKMVEYVVCFQCSRFEEFAGGVKQRDGLLNRDVQPVFDKPLTDAGISLAPKE
jgi:hypothetical protein